MEKQISALAQPAVDENANKDEITSAYIKPTLTSKYTIMDLNDDCLINIVKILDVPSQVRFAMVTLRFKMILEMCSPTEHKSLDLYPFHYMQNKEITHFFELGGKNIRHLFGLSICDRLLLNICETINMECPHLEEIEMCDCSIQSSSLRFLLNGLKFVTALILNECQLRDHDIIALQKLPNLKYLSLAENLFLSGAHMCKIHNLVDLNIQSNDLLSEHFKAICNNLIKLQHLNIIDCNDNLTAGDYFALVEGLQNLEILEISANRHIPYEQLSKMPCLKNLHLEIYDSNAVRHELFKFLSRNADNRMETLKVLQAHSITLEDATHISRLNKLKCLQIYFSNFGIDCLRKLAECKNLEEICIANNRLMTNDHLLELIRYGRKLKYISVECCSLISNDFIENAIKILQNRTEMMKEPLILNVADTAVNQDILEYFDGQNYLKLIFNSTIKNKYML